MVWSSVPHSRATEAAIPYLCKQERKRVTPVWRWLSWTHAVLGRAIPGGWVGMKIWNLVVLSNISAFHWSSDELMSCCLTGTNGCLHLKCCAFPHNGQVSAEWSRCPVSMERHARDSVAPLRRRSAGMPARIGRLSAGVGRRQLVTVRKVSLMAGQ